MQYVYVLSKHGEPLMPCSSGKARLLLKQQKACVVKRTPFTIKLLFGRYVRSRGIGEIAESVRLPTFALPFVAHICHA